MYTSHSLALRLGNLLNNSFNEFAIESYNLPNNQRNIPELTSISDTCFLKLAKSYMDAVVSSLVRAAVSSVHLI